MGLTIYYRLSVAKNISPDGVRELVQPVAQYARKIGCAEVSAPLRPFREPVHSRLSVRAGRPEDVDRAEVENLRSCGKTASFSSSAWTSLFFAACD